MADFRLPAEPDAAAVARSRVADIVRSLPMGLNEEQDVLIAVGEALTNAIKHGCGCDPAKHISVRCVAGPMRLAIDVSDLGPGFDPESVGAPSPDSLKEGGMGIHMMRQIMDDVSFTFDGGTTVRLVKRINCDLANGETSGDEMACV